jgi:hypothetical protein
MNGETQQKYANWLQFAVLLITLFALAIHGEGRLARVEQKLEDGDRDRANMMQQIQNLNDKVDRWYLSQHQLQTAQ